MTATRVAPHSKTWSGAKSKTSDSRWDCAVAWLLDHRLVWPVTAIFVFFFPTVPAAAAATTTSTTTVTTAAAASMHTTGHDGVS
jgi:hypothetical protein